MKASAGHEAEALAYMFFSAFGTTLQDCMAAVEKALKNDDDKVLTMMVAAAVQIRGNVVFVGPEYAGMKVAYPKLIIDGERDQKDIFNFSALHICGHILAHLTSASLGSAILKKGGDCVLAEIKLDSEAGKINAEVAAHWTDADRQEFKAWADNETLEKSADSFFNKLPMMKAKFDALLKGGSSDATAGDEEKKGAGTKGRTTSSTPASGGTSGG